MVFACVRGQPRVIDMSFGYEPQPIPLLSNGVDDANFKLTFQVREPDCRCCYTPGEAEPSLMSITVHDYSTCPLQSAVRAACYLHPISKRVAARVLGSAMLARAHVPADTPIEHSPSRYGEPRRSLTWSTTSCPLITLTCTMAFTMPVFSRDMLRCCRDCRVLTS